MFSEIFAIPLILCQGVSLPLPRLDFVAEAHDCLGKPKEDPLFLFVFPVLNVISFRGFALVRHF
jgi:hypothetical protein